MNTHKYSHRFTVFFCFVFHTHKYVSYITFLFSFYKDIVYYHTRKLYIGNINNTYYNVLEIQQITMSLNFKSELNTKKTWTICDRCAIISDLMFFQYKYFCT